VLSWQIQISTFGDSLSLDLRILPTIFFLVLDTPKKFWPTLLLRLFYFINYITHESGGDEFGFLSNHDEI
jgi:hypothetical protein